jgi:DNA topoisomerase VI subunit B
VPAEYRPIRIADMGAALRLLSEVYSDARRALSEFISNSADAFVLGERQGIRRNWCCELYLGPKDIKVLDNGPGITRERLLELPSHVTLSAKSGDLQQKGHKAIGLLAYGKIGRASCRERV